MRHLKKTRSATSEKAIQLFFGEFCLAMIHDRQNYTQGTNCL